MKLNSNAYSIVMSLAGFAGALCVAAACYGFGYAPLSEESVKLRQRKEMLEQLHRSRDSILAKNRTIQKSIELLRPGQQGLLTRLPDAPREDELLQQLSRLAKKSEIPLQDFQPGGHSKVGDLRFTIVRLQLRGDYGKLCRFISGIENLKRLTRIAGLKVHVADPVKGTLDIHIRLLAFFQPVESIPVK